MTDGGRPANGNHDLRFTLHDAATQGAAVGNPVTLGSAAVAEGVFTVTLDFGVGAFSGAPRWIEIGVRPGGSASAFTVLNPRQPVTPAPMAQFAMTPAGPQGPKGDPGEVGPPGATSPQGPAGISGRTVRNGSGPPSSAVGSLVDFYLDTAATLLYGPKTAAGWGVGVSMAGPPGTHGVAGATGPAGPQGPAGPTDAQGPAGPRGLTGATGAQGVEGPPRSQGPAGSPGSADAWSRIGNAGTTAGVNFLGTIDAQPLQLRVNNTPAIHVQSDGRVGFGTTTLDPEAVAQFNLPSSTSVPHVRITSPLGNAAFGLSFANPEETWTVGPNLGNFADDRFAIMAQSIQKGLIIAPNGNVGIDASSASLPFTDLTVRGSIGFPDISSPAMFVYPSGTANAEKMLIAHSPAFPGYGL